MQRDLPMASLDEVRHDGLCGVSEHEHEELWVVVQHLGVVNEGLQLRL